MVTNIVKSLGSDLLYYLDKKNHSLEEIKRIINLYPEIKFVSLVGVDLGGNDTDEKIPISIFLEDLDKFLEEGIQTDGSSVVLPGIASLNNGKVDIIPDNDVKWFVDYNYDNIDLSTDKPVGTLRIPCFLKHKGEFIDSRSILKKVVTNFKEEVIELFSNNNMSKAFNISKDEIIDVILTSATELEFWVRTPENNNVKVKELSTSQVMQEQYWKRTKGTVRTALERSLLILDKYGLEAEMGHKEVGGVKAKLTSDGTTTNIMEQLEIDWKYAESLQTADNELLARTFVKEIFQHHGLDVSFKAKPIEGVAGSGEHTHVGVSLKLKNGKIINLFTPENMTKEYLSIPGWGALMGILNNYEIINPFISATNDSLERLKPGFEAPVSIVASIGNDIATPSRNRTVLLGLIRDLNNPFATRFEVRSPNPHSNTYLVIATLYQCMLEGIKYAVESSKTEKELEAEFNKKQGESADYLAKDREYRSELDVFDEYTEEERNSLFGKPPSTVWENLKGFKDYPAKLQTLYYGGIFNDNIINSYYLGVLRRWYTEINSRILPQSAKLIKNFKKIHNEDYEISHLDEKRWNEILMLKVELLKDTDNSISLFTQLRNAIEQGSYDQVSELQLEVYEKVKKIKELYTIYKRNIL
ncbi:MAG: glutamine synthetase [Fusobacteria bacterium]|nr:glutamine synthetase [Fusobacteriota bacterium]